jgi:hypothetical protein
VDPTLVALATLLFDPPTRGRLLGTLVLNALQGFLAAREVWPWLAIWRAALLALLTTVNLLTFATSASIKVSLEALDAPITAGVPGFTAPTSFAHPADSISDSVIHTLKAWLTLLIITAPLVICAAVIATTSTLLALAIHTLQAILAACEVREGEPIRIAAHFTLLTTVDLFAFAVAVAAVRILIAALDGAITAGSPSHTTTRSLAHQPSNVGNNVLGALQAIFARFTAVCIPATVLVICATGTATASHTPVVL